jgi:signal transduction histidine kinase
LRPATLDDLGLLATLSWHCRTFQDIYADIAIEKQIEIQEGEVPVKLRTAIYRIVQEALNNVAKHAKADRVVLGLRKTGSAIELIITDDGCGFDVDEVLKGDLGERGLGLAGMRQRCENSGGSLHIDSSSGTGTVIRAVWPG